MSPLLKPWLLANLLALALFAAGQPCAMAQVTGPARLIGYSVNNDEPDKKLYRIDMTTGEATAIGPTGTSKIEALAFGVDGQLYGVNPATAQLLKCSTVNGACSVVGSLSGIAPTLTGNAGLALAADGQLYLAVNAGLFRLDPATGNATFVGATGVAVAGLAGLAPQSGCASGLYALGSNTDRGRFYCVNTANGSLNLIGNLTGVSAVDAGLDADPVSGILYGVADNGTSVAQIFSFTPSKLVAENVRPVLANGVELTGLESLAILRQSSSDLQPADTDPRAVPVGGLWSAALVLLLVLGARSRLHLS